MFCFVVLCKHANKAPDAAAQNGHQEQCFFRHPPSAANGTFFIQGHGAKQHDIDDEVIPCDNPEGYGVKGKLHVISPRFSSPDRLCPAPAAALPLLPDWSQRECCGCRTGGTGCCILRKTGEKQGHAGRSSRPDRC